MKKRKTKYNLLFYSMIVLSIFSVGILSTLLLSPNVRKSLSNSKELEAKNSNGTPLRSKVLRDNGDGTYTLSLDVTGDSEKITPKVNVIVIVDRSGSMGEGSGTGAYVAANDTSDNRFGLVNGQYIRLTREGNTYNRTYWYTNSAGEQVQYTGQRYQYDSSATRLEATKAAVNKLANKLLGYNGNGNPDDTVEMSLISFSGPNQPTPQIQTNVRKTNTFTTYETAVNGLGAQGGTNWEIALQTANGIDFEDDDPTFVIFFTDGAPTRYGTSSGTGQEREPNMRESYNAATDDAATLAQNVGVNNFYTIFAYGTNTGSNYLKNLTAAAGSPATNNYSASSTAELEAAFDEILSKIEQAGFADVSINDGTTAAVQASSGSVSGGLLEVDTNFKYYLSFPLKENGQSDIPEITNITLVSNDQYKLTDANGNEYTVTRVPAYEQDTTTGRETDVVLENVFKFEWVDAQNPLHKTTPPAATFDENPTIKDEENNDIPNPNYGAVDWDLSSLDVLKNNVTYTVSFNCYPSQVTLDIIADIKNDPSSYEDLDETVKKYLDSNGNLKTNTGATLTYDDTRTTADESRVPIEFNDVTPVETKTVEALSVAKEWDGGDPDPKITLYVDRDNDLKKYYTELSSPTYKGSVNASIGIMKYDNEGNVTILTPGHDYKFSEDVELSHIWDFTTPTIHPMMINGRVYTLLQVPDGTVTMTKDHEIHGENEYFRLTFKNGDTTTTKTYIVGSEDAVLTAKNVKRSHLDFNKVVVGKDAANANPEDLFTFDATITTKTGTDFWFSIWNGSGYVVNTTDKQYITNATQEVIEVNTNDTANIQNWNKTDSVITYKERNAITGLFEDKKISSYVSCTEVSEGKYSIVTGFYYAPSGTHVTYQLQRDWNVRFTYVPTGSTYTIKELVEEEYLDEAYRFIDITGVGTQDNRQVTGSEVTGTLKEASTTYKETFKNEYLLTHVDVEKVWDDADNQDGKRPDSVTVVLKRDGVEVEGKSVVLDGKTTIKDETTGEEVADPNEKVAWKTTFDNLPVYNKTTNQPYVYTTDEIITSNDYQKDVTCNMVGTQTEGETTEGEEGEEASEDEGDPDPTAQSTMSCVITNTHTPETKKVKVVKVWEDANDQDGLRRSGNTTATVALTEDGTASSTMKVTSGTDITTNRFESEVYTVPVYKAGAVGQEIAYSAVEASVPTGYDKSDVATTTETIDGETVTVFTITNTHEPEKDDVTVTKVWNDENNYEGLRPEKVIFQLKANGENYGDPVEVTFENNISENTWKYTFPDLDVNAGGDPIVYTVVETETPTGYQKTESGLTVTNSRSVSKISITVTKVWDDEDNYEGLRTPVTFYLYGTDKTIPVAEATFNGTTTDEDGNWTYTFTDLDEYANGQVINYTIDEADLEYYDKEIEGLTITNSRDIEKTTVTVTKVWDDEDNYEGLRTPVTFYLYGVDKEEAIASATLDGSTTDDDGNWTYTFTNLDKYANGEEIEYTVDEEELEFYDKDIDGLTVTNSRDVEKIELTVTKVWDDEDNYEGLRTPVTFYLYGVDKDEAIASATLDGSTTDEDGNWTYTFTNLDKYANGEEIEYTIDEEELEFYDKDIDGLTITNSRDVEKIELTVTKVWDDEDNYEGLRTPVTFYLYGVDKDEAIASATLDGSTTDDDGNWTYTFTNLDKYANGEEIEYSIDEEELEFYDKDIDGLTITNSREVEKIDLEVKKVWDDGSNYEGLRPPSITFYLYGVDKETSVAEATLSGSGNEWTYTFRNLDKYANGEEIEYTIDEVEDENYEKDIDGLTITNSREVEKTNITVTKVWDDEDNYEGLRTPVTFYLYGVDKEEPIAEATLDGTTTDEDGNWTYTFTNLDVYANGEEIEYTIDEEELEFYDKDIDGLTITNSREVEKIELTVTKVWDDEDNYEGLRTPVTFYLYGIDKTTPVAEATLDGTTTDEDGNWTYTFTNLDKYANGEEIEYSIDEADLDNYDKDIDGLTITNSREVEKTTVKVTKVWDDDDDSEGFRPDSVTFNLFGVNKETPVASITLSENSEKDEDGNWTYTFTDLDVYAEGKTINYTVEEATTTTITGTDGTGTYATSTSGTMAAGYVITNTHTPETTTSTVVKVWDDNSNQDKVRPAVADIEFQLQANGTDVGEPVTLTDAGNNRWTYTVSNLPKYADGELIEYTWVEDEASLNELGYTLTSAELSNDKLTYTMTNYRETDKITINGKKTWDDSSNNDKVRPTDGIDVQLYANGNPEGKPQHLEYSDDDEWTFTFPDLEVNDENGAITYTVDEVSVPQYYDKTQTGNKENGYEIINKHDKEPTSVKVKKVWDDDSNRDAIQPENVQIQLKANGDIVGSKYLPEDGKWETTFTGLDKLYNGEEIEYTVEEVKTDVITGTDGAETYAVSVSGDQESGYIITNTHTPVKTQVTVTKVWDDDDNRDALRPGTITVNLYQDDSTTPFRTATVTFDKDINENKWTYTFEDLPKYKNVGGKKVEIAYNIDENEVDSYHGEVDNEKYTITNSHDTEKTKITGYKVWKDDSDKEGKRPGSVTIKLYANGEFYDSKEVSGGKDNEWAYTFEDLPVWYNDGGEAKKVVYTVAEADVANGYVSTIKDKNSETDKFIIINTITGTTEVSGKKIWDDDNNRDGVRLSSVTIVLNADGKKLEGEAYSKTLNETNGWEYSWTELPKYNEDGTKIVYSVTEELSEDDAKVYTANYETEGNKLNVKNVHTPAKFDINGTKAWDDDNNRDGLRPETVTIALNADGKQIETYTAKAADGWKYEFKGLNKYRDGGVEIKYTLTEIQEASEEGEEGTEEEKEPIYTPIIDGYTITNKHVPETVSYKVSKVWDDDENRDGIRPESITVNLLADGNKVESKTVTGPKWECEFTGLPKYKKGEVGVPIVYTITEDIKEGYTASIVPQVENPTEVVITNTHTPDTIDLDITKTWEGDEDHLDQRPKFVTVYLYADGELIDTITVKEDEEWKYIVENMFKYKGGVPIKYTIDEKDVEGYIKNIDGLNVINTRDSSGDVVPDEEPPHTKADYNYVYEFVIATLSGIVISFKKEY